MTEIATALEKFRRATRGDMHGVELDAFADLSRAVVAFSAPQDGWRPIATAPLDGTEVDLWCSYPGGGRATDCHFHGGEWLKYGCDPEIGFFKIQHATHWRPLPEAPAA